LLIHAEVYIKKQQTKRFQHRVNYFK